MNNQPETVQPRAPVAQEPAKRRPSGTPWPKGVSGNPSGSTVSKRFAALYDAMLAEFGDAVLTASDRALLSQACRLLCRRMRDDEVAVKASNAARHIIDGLRERYKATPRSATAQWSPLRTSLAKATSEPEGTAA
jgi:hypothetical protein